MNRTAAAQKLVEAQSNLANSTVYANATGTDRSRFSVVVSGLTIAAALVREQSIDASRARTLSKMLLEVFTATTSYKVWKARYPGSWTQAKIGKAELALREALAYLEPVVVEPAPEEPVEEPEPSQPAPVWARIGTFVDNVSGFGDFRFAVSDGGLGWWAPQVQNGSDNARPDNMAELKTHAAVYGPAMRMCPWVVCYDSPELEALGTAKRLNELEQYGYTIEGLVVNGEADWLGNDRARRFLVALSAQLGTLPPILFSLLGSPIGENVYPLDYGLLSQHGDVAPQCYPGITLEKYPNVTPTDYSVTRSVEHYVRRAGLPTQTIHPTLGLDETDRGPYTIADFVREMRGVRTLGFSTYLGDNGTTREDWVELKKAAVAYNLAIV